MFLIPYGNHAQIVGGSAAERLMSALAYGWVECCSNIASCEMRFISKISILVLKSLQVIVVDELW